jgi:hypothetical protein
MPKEGIFCRVLQGGVLKSGDRLEYQPRVMQVRIITLSDRASRCEYSDRSGPLLEKMTEDFFSAGGRPIQVARVIIPDDPDQLKALILEYSGTGADMILPQAPNRPQDIARMLKPCSIKRSGIMNDTCKYGMQFPEP